MNPLVYGICVVNEPSISGKESLESGKESKFGKESNGKESKCKCSETSYVTLFFGRACGVLLCFSIGDSIIKIINSRSHCKLN